MKFLTTLLTKIQNFFQQKETLVKEETFLCLFLKYGTDFIFLSPTKKNVSDAKLFKPLIIPLSIGPIEDNFFRINDFMINEFDISPDKIRIAKEYFSLSPIKDQTYYFAIIDISKEDVQELNKRENLGFFSNLPLPYISLKADDNFFFQIIVKLVAENPYMFNNNLEIKGG